MTVVVWFNWDAFVKNTLWFGLNEVFGEKTSCGFV